MALRMVTVVLKAKVVGRIPGFQLSSLGSSRPVVGGTTRTDPMQTQRFNTTQINKPRTAPIAKSAGIMPKQELPDKEVSTVVSALTQLPIFFDNAERAKFENMLPIPVLPSNGFPVYMRDPVSLMKQVPITESASLQLRLTAKLRNLFNIHSSKYATPYIATRLVQDVLSIENTQEQFYWQTLGLPRNYQAWFAVVDLHLWMLFVRFRKESANKHLFNLSVSIMNTLMTACQTRLEGPLYQIPSTNQIRKIVKESHELHQGSMLGYDESILRGDPVLAMALWRNVFAGSHKISPRQIALLVQHVRWQMHLFDHTPIEYFSEAGCLPFAMPVSKLRTMVLNRKSRPKLFKQTPDELNFESQPDE